ncbi:MAG TPA: prolyl oligopeptidase family serine peptidase [Terriglobales bacterium]|jgi:predicted peptidase|nr:prolyl oligopeptidase family serine peptidase [Terriglobales bacterium]
MITRREVVRLAVSAPAGVWLAAAHMGLNFSFAPSAFAAKSDSTPPLAPGTPMSPERLALIEAFKKQSDGLEKKFEARTHKSDWVMPYRLFRPETTGKLPLVVYLHGSGGLGDDNLKQLGFGNIFGTRVWLLPENRKNFPCYVLVPQTDRGWCRYDLSQKDPGPAKVLPGLGDGSRLALEVVDAVRREFAIDDRRIYVMGQSMGGAGTWNVITNRPRFFAAAVICCGSASSEDGTGAIETPLWNFHGESDQAVPVSLSRDRMAARRKAGGHPLYTEYAGVDHNVYEWAFTEPELPQWLFAQRRS